MEYDKEKLRAQLYRHEVDPRICKCGDRWVLYKCPAGANTIGVGRNLDANGLSDEEAMYLLENDIREAERGLVQILTGYRVSLESVSPVRFAALVNVCFNIGKPSLSGFVRMFRAIRQQDWNKAGDELLDSDYASDDPAVGVGDRADELAEQIRTGEYKNV